jgi:hypothetical protein
MAVLCWRLHIKIDDEDHPITEIIPTDEYTDSVINDLYAYYNWLCDEFRWFIADVDLVETPIKKVCIPKWVGFVKEYGDGSCLHIDNWDWKRPIRKNEDEKEPIVCEM